MNPGWYLNTHNEYLLVEKVHISQHKTCRTGVSGFEGKLKVKSSILLNEEMCTTNSSDGKLNDLLWKKKGIDNSGLSHMS